MSQTIHQKASEIIVILISILSGVFVWMRRRSTKADKISVVGEKLTYSTKFKVRFWHLDRGCHANWLRQLGVAEAIQHKLRNQAGFGLKFMKKNYGLFLVMGKVTNVSYRKQLRWREMIDAEISVWVAGKASLEFKCVFSRDGNVVTEMSWVMPLVSSKTGKLTEIPAWMIDILGNIK